MHFLASCSVATLLSFLVRVYVRPVEVCGSTLVKMSVDGTVKISGTGGYLNERDGP